MHRTFRISASVALAALLFGAAAQPAHADRNKARTSVSSKKNVRTDVDVNRNVRRDVDVNRNVRRDVDIDVDRNVRRDIDVDIDRDRDIDIDIDRHGCCYYGSGWGTAAAVATTAVVTAAVVGSRVNTLPPNCTVMMANGVTYQQCGTVYYQPQFVGTTPTYVVVNSPY
jgi:hypothetical protein